MRLGGGMINKVKSFIFPLLIFLLISILLSGCVGSAFRTRAQLTKNEAVQRLLLMPMDVELMTLTTGGILKPEAEWTHNAKKHIRQSLANQLGRMNVQMITNQDLTDIQLSSEEETKRLQLIKLHEVVGQTILWHQYIAAAKLPNKKEAFNWTLGPEARFLKRKFGADYALFIFMRDSYASGGRVAFSIALAFLGVAVPLGQQVGFASLVDLETGQIIWFNRLAREVGDLRTQEAAANSVSLLLSDFPS